MTAITFLDDRVTMLIGDVRARLKALPDNFFDTVVTSPPYWGLRDYGTGRWEGGNPDCEHRSPTMREGRNEKRTMIKGAATNSAQNILAHNSRCGKCGAVKVDDQIGLERTLGEHLAVMVEVFDEVRRVLKPTGTLWLNYGDCYATAPNGRSAADTKAAGNDDRSFRDKPFSTIGPIFAPDHESGDRRGNSPSKQHRNTGSNHTGRIVAGGYLKPKDLCMIPNRLAIALQDAGWWVRSEIVWGKSNPMPDSSGKYRPSTAHEKIFMLAKSSNCFYDAEAVALRPRQSSIARWKQQVDQQDGSKRANGGTRTERPMKAVGGPRKEKQRGHSRPHQGFNERWDQMSREEQQANGRYLRNYEQAPVDVWNIPTEAFSGAHFATFPPELAARCILAGCPEGGHVLDPFGGAGTTALVATALGRSATLIELNPDYATLARARIEASFMGKQEGAHHMVRRTGKTTDAGPLFTGAAE